jgi:hypothetical protein
MIEENKTFENISLILDENDAVEPKITIFPDKNREMYLHFFRDHVDLSKEKDRIFFIKCCEDIIRNSDEYKAYIAHLINDIPEQNHCVFHKYIGIDNIGIEMHHGPIFTLFDIVEITILYFMKTNKLISDFRIFQSVMEDHFSHLINTVPLCKNCHLATQNHKNNVKKPFIGINQSFGDIVGFIKRYKDVFSYRHINKIRNYLHQEEWYRENSDDDVVFKESIKSFK